jgi:XTP/dITP diphosphohydrolase
MPSRILTLATRNRHKVTELAEQMPPSWKVQSVANIAGLPEIEETGATFLANATLKAEGISRHVPGLVLADDSGLEVDALSGAPGVYSARYAGQPTSDAKNNEKLLKELDEKGATQPEQRKARFRCVLVVAEQGKTIASFDGTVEGHVAAELSGSHGFGYDPLFIPDGYTESFGSLSSEIKAHISHRAKAMAQFLSWVARR